MPAVEFNRFYRYEELTGLLQSIAEEHPDFVRLESLGKSYEGRDIWLLRVTNFKSGPDTEKPAFWVDGNIHASEVSASTACLYHLNYLLARYGQDEQVTRVLDRRAFYIVPRLNPDGAEWALADRPKIVRSSTRPFPYDEEVIEGLVPFEDVDGDGRILFMRLPDPNGAWKVHPEEPRLMVRRDPVETGGDYYRVVPEGPVVNYDGHTLPIQPAREGLDLNRNFPMEWRNHPEQAGAGDYPLSEPEIQAMAAFINRHKNLTGFTTFHTFSGVLLRPYASKADEELPVPDLWAYQETGKKGTDLTGYPNISIFKDFRYHPKQVITGGSDWVYEHQGIFFWAVELWSPQRQAGIEDYKYIDWFRDHPVEDDLQLLRWNDEQLGGKAYVDWYPFDHPGLGRVELGGWDRLHYWTNPPPDRLEEEVQRFPRWLVWQALLAPELVLRHAGAEKIGAEDYRVRLVVDNAGWLSTAVTQKAVDRKIVRGVICEIELPEGASLASGRMREQFGQLEGRQRISAMTFLIPAENQTSDRLKAEWVVHAPQGGEVRLTARHERAGVVRARLVLRD
jgi:murein tripeptide amidase MpaA